MIKNIIFISLISIFILSCKKEQVNIIYPKNSHVRIQFGAEKIAKTLKEYNYKVSINEAVHNKNLTSIIIQLASDSLLSAKESYSIKSDSNSVIITGSDASGALYGCIELVKLISKNNKIPVINIIEQPEMVMRGACIGLQKTTYLPGRHVYEYPYTPENFPWFYDKKLWIEYLDMLVENKMNSLYLWNGHPFASLVKLNDYPYAVEVDDETFKKNEEIFSFLTEEANKRGIWVIQMFYNIIVSKPFAEKNNLKTQDRSRPIIPIIADYTRKSIAAFIEKYPNVGLMVCLGEAIGTDEDDVEWFTKTIIPGVKDGLNALATEIEPPIILRGHDTKADLVMEAALPIYKNLYTTHKYNGESLTTYEPGDSWATIHQKLSSLGSVHISNVHILANLEPFRYGSPDFIQKSVKAMHKIQGANGLHLYPQTSYWDWPYTADNTFPRLLQTYRDWIWYKAWARYAWKSDYDKQNEIIFWNNELDNFYESGEYSKFILEAYEQTGEIAPKLLRRFGISDGNRQTLLLGMFMSQLVNPYKWRVYSNFYTSNGPVGEILIDYAEKEWKGEKHIGETPPQIIKEVVEHGKLAVEAIEKVKTVNKNKDEFIRLKNDVYCYNAFANYFAERVKAAMLVLRYKYSKNIADLEEAILYLKKSVNYYKELTNFTKDTYLYANSMQTQQRRIPIDGTDGKNKTWVELLPLYEKELENFIDNVNLLKSGGLEAKEYNPLNPVEVEVLNDSIPFINIKKGQKLYSDKNYKINDLAIELKELKGLQLNFNKQKEKGTEIHFKNKKPVKVVVGYFNGHSYAILPPPTLETNANANDRGQADIKIANAMDIPGLYPVNIYTYKYEAGENMLKLNKGIVLILGFIDGNEEIKTKDAGISEGGENVEGIDWLFY